MADGVGTRFAPAHAAPFESIADHRLAGTLHRTAADLPAVGHIPRVSSSLDQQNADGDCGINKCALFGAFNQAVILADRGGIRLQRSDDIKFVEDQIALKAVSRYDMNVHDPGDSSNAGAYVALSTHS